MKGSVFKHSSSLLGGVVGWIAVVRNRHAPQMGDEQPLSPLVDEALLDDLTARAERAYRGLVDDADTLRQYITKGAFPPSRYARCHSRSLSPGTQNNGLNKRVNQVWHQIMPRFQLQATPRTRFFGRPTPSLVGDVGHLLPARVNRTCSHPLLLGTPAARERANLIASLLHYYDVPLRSQLLQAANRIRAALPEVCVLKGYFYYRRLLMGTLAYW
jgi:hypothetical protein